MLLCPRVKARTSEAKARAFEAKAEDLTSKAKLTWPRGQVHGRQDDISDMN